MSDDEERMGREDYSGTHEGDYITPESVEPIVSAMETMSEAPSRSDTELMDNVTSETLSGTAQDIREGMS